MAIYELALTAAPTYDGMGVRRPPGPLEKRVQKHVDALEAAGVKSTVGTDQDPYNRLQSLKAIQLGPIAGSKGRASYRCC